MANLASALTGRTDSLARRSTEDLLTSGSTPTLAKASTRPAPPQGTATQPVPDTVNDHAKRVATAGDSSAVAIPERPLSGPEGRLGASGEPVVKWTLELAPQLIMALNVWERDETKRLGERVFRERMIDQALDRLPEELDDILCLVSELPVALRRAPGQQFGTRVRGSVRDKLLALRPELRVAGIKDIRIRDIYSAGVYKYLTGLGIDVDVTPPEPRNLET